MRRIGILLLLAMALQACTAKRKIVTDSKRISEHAEKAPAELAAFYAAALNVPVRELGDLKLYRLIDQWMGVPHRLGGSDKSGIDCSAFTGLIQKEVFQVQAPRTSAAMAAAVRPKSAAELKAGDLVFFDFNGQPFSHVGVYLANNKFVHASTSKGVIISDLTDRWYNQYFSKAGTLR